MGMGTTRQCNAYISCKGSKKWNDTESSRTHSWLYSRLFRNQSSNHEETRRILWSSGILHGGCHWEILEQGKHYNHGLQDWLSQYLPMTRSFHEASKRIVTFVMMLWFVGQFEYRQKTISRLDRKHVGSYIQQDCIVNTSIDQARVRACRIEAGLCKNQSGCLHTKGTVILLALWASDCRLCIPYFRTAKSYTCSQLKMYQKQTDSPFAARIVQETAGYCVNMQ
jgi:hypothetical protein